MKFNFFLFTLFFSSFFTFSQVNENQFGAWYMYFYSYKFNNSNWGIQGDFQHRNWNLVGDKEQLLLRSGITYAPKDSGILFTLGVANISTGQFGESETSINENRIYQEVLFPQKIGNRVLITHRFRYEQRFVENQDFRTRYRYNLFVNIPFNNKDFSPKTIYGTFYNELFINGEKEIGNNTSVEFFDRNRTYFGIGYVLNSTMRFQFGIMKQTNDLYSKNQLQLSMHHNF
jgi:hypothetical protein